MLGNAMAGEQHYLTALRIAFPEFARDLGGAPSFAALPQDVRAAIAAELHARHRRAGFPRDHRGHDARRAGNFIAGRVANLFNLHGPNFVVDAACASAMAAMDAAVEGLRRARVRRRGHRRHRPQHGRVHVHQVLQDRRAVGHRHPPLRATAPTAS